MRKSPSAGDGIIARQPTTPEAAREEQLPLRQPLSRLEIPADVAVAVTATCRHLGLRSAQEVLRLEEEFKLQYYYGGRDVVCLDTPGGRVVVAVGSPVIANLTEVLRALSAAERSRISLLSPEPWEESTATSPSVAFDETEDSPGPAC